MILIMEEFWNNRYAEKDFAYGAPRLIEVEQVKLWYNEKQIKWA
jgi:hypothetical protein